MPEQFLSELRAHVPGALLPPNAFRDEVARRRRVGVQGFLWYCFLGVISGVLTWLALAPFDLQGRVAFVLVFAGVLTVTVLGVEYVFGVRCAAFPPRTSSLQQAVFDEWGMRVLSEDEINHVAAMAKGSEAEAIWAGWRAPSKFLYERDARIVRRYLYSIGRP